MVDLIWKMGGQAGEGAMVTGRTLGKTFTRGGLNVIGYPEYPSLIRGGHNTYQIRVSDAAINSPLQKIDVVVALNKEGIYFHHANLKDGGALVYDEAIDISKYPIRADIRKCPMPFSRRCISNVIAWWRPVARKGSVSPWPRPCSRGCR